MSKKLHTKQWFKNRIDKRIFRDKGTCNCIHCKEVTAKGLIVNDEQHADYLYMVQNDFANDGTLLNYRDKI